MAKKKRKRHPGSAPERVTPKPVTLTADVPSVTVQTVTAKVHQGPLPAPEVLAEYEAIHPGLAERIVRLAEIPVEMASTQQAHRIATEKQVIRSDIRRSWAGLIIGGLVVGVVLGIGVWCLATGRTVAGLAPILSALGVLVAAFVRSDQRREKERQRVERAALEAATDR